MSKFDLSTFVAVVETEDEGLISMMRDKLGKEVFDTVLEKVQYRIKNCRIVFHDGISWVKSQKTKESVAFKFCFAHRRRIEQSCMVLKGGELYRYNGRKELQKKKVDILRNIREVRIYLPDEKIETKTIKRGETREVEKKAIKLPLECHTKDVAALSMRAPTEYRWFNIKNGVERRAIYPNKRWGEIPTYKSRGHNGQVERKEVIKNKYQNLIRLLEVGEEIEEGEKVRVILYNFNRAVFFRKEVYKRYGKVAEVRLPNPESRRGTYIVSFIA